MSEPVIPDALSLDEAYRAAYYMVVQYLELEANPSFDVEMYAQYLRSDPAQWSDWQAAVVRALGDGGAANPLH